MQSFSRLSWRFLLAAIVLVPLVVGAIPPTGAPTMINVFVQAKVVVLALLLALSLGTWALTHLQSGDLYVGRSLLPWGAFFFAAGLATLSAIDPRTAFFGDFEQGVGLLVFLLCGLAGFMTTQHVRNTTRMGELTTAVIITATAVALIGLMQQVFSVDLLGIAGEQFPEWLLQRGYGTIGNPDTYAAYLVPAALLALHRLRQAKSTKERGAWAGAAAVLLVSTILAQTRGPIVGLIVGGIAYALIELRRPSKPDARSVMTGRTSLPVIGGTIVAAIGAGILAARYFGTASNVLERYANVESLAALGGRIPLWRQAIEIAAARPLLGVGPDSFRLGWYQVRDIAHLELGAGLVITDPHSVPLLMVATMGVLGLLASTAFLISMLVGGYRTATCQDGAARSGDYLGWFAAAVALSITMLSSMLTTIMLFMLFTAAGVLLAPSLRSHQPVPSLRAALRALSIICSLALLSYSAVTTAAHTIAMSERAGDVQVASQRATRAVSLAPWDTGLRHLRDQMMVQAALELVFTDQPGAADTVTAVANELSLASTDNPDEYLHSYREALVLIGAGQRLGDQYTRRGIDAGLRALTVYPNSIEMRTGLGSGYLQVKEPTRAEELLRDVWDVDPRYLSSGRVYVEALIAQEKYDTARESLDTLQERFGGDPSLALLETALTEADQTQ